MSDLRSDHGPHPYTLNIDEATRANDAFRDTLWTGRLLQMTVMAIPAGGGEIGAEIHDGHDQFLRLEQGRARVMIGEGPENLAIDRIVGDDDAVFVPARKWHNLVNEFDEPVKLYSIYAAPEHTHGTVHETKAEADKE
ncbi:cupin domain-containing protein [Corynebacterium guangdongense]|uniref:Mannose-6-phosphate isomerase-like protein (Cupin superfamily) n=1 Tax=Corynebacterium guangdongense TaxID=1783348 RepID=A0ABU1ZWP4_9CORY|nr:cupin domain-containing protein [Corynebacterium guangdongense]MDR7329357.1 mannose-6-phosphate isomerase-like protein (cupin superfamily) [Corynebacterium guangdongense]WJZ17922.1 Cupin domain protein [Corynebacterium guangdongense]